MRAAVTRVIAAGAAFAPNSVEAVTALPADAPTAMTATAGGAGTAALSGLNESGPIDPVAGAASAPKPPVSASAATAVSEATPQDMSRPPVELREEEFIPRRLLTVAPVPEVAINIPTPPGQESSHQSSVFSLYIDEAGTVVRIVSNDGSLPQDLDIASRQAFFQARFKPGEVKGRPVKSLIKIEVRFETITFDLPPKPATTAASGS